MNVLQRIGIPLQVLSQRALCAGLSSLTHATLPLWQSSSSVDQQGSSLARQVGAVMGLPHQSPAFLLGAGSSADPDSALLLDTNIQVRCPACPSPAQGRRLAIKHVKHAIAGGIRQHLLGPKPELSLDTRLQVRCSRILLPRPRAMH